ncbi:MAG TPA: hypothetical protein VEQ60_30450 [Longimicrobium sp.]|nr:hypothetical protein [Longimicrobium sp.]
MSTETWIPIRYRDFYDIPRAFVIQRGAETLLFDCPFDDELDDYPEHYTVIRLEPGAAATLDQSSWHGLAGRGLLLGTVPTRQVRFDPTRRTAVDAAVLAHL